MAEIRLTPRERARRRAFGRTSLLSSAIRATGRKGFTETRAALEKHEDKIKSPSKLAGWLKGQAKRKGVLSPEHHSHSSEHHGHSYGKRRK